MLFVSNYSCTVLLKRSEHVHNETRWAFEPIWWDQQHPSARSCWLKFPCVADEMQDTKPRLPRTVVPRTANGYILPQISIVDSHLAANRSLCPRPQPTIRLMASSITHKGYELVPNKTAYVQAQTACSSSQLAQWKVTSLPCCERIQHAYALGYEQPSLTPCPRNHIYGKLLYRIKACQQQTAMHQKIHRQHAGQVDGLACPDTHSSFVAKGRHGLQSGRSCWQPCT